MCIAYFGAAFTLMTALNAYAASRMPLGSLLPDAAHPAFPIAGTLRNESLGTFQLGHLGCIINGAIVTVCWLAKPHAMDGRRGFVVWATVAWLRALAFTLTSRPAPCLGLPRCPCADPEVIIIIIRQIATVATWRIALAWALGMRIAAQYPQCGDLIISGHTVAVVPIEPTQTQIV